MFFEESFPLLLHTRIFSFHLTPVRRLRDDRHVLIRLSNCEICKDPKTMAAEESGKVVDPAVRYQHWIRRKISGYDTLERTVCCGFPPRSNSLIVRWRIHTLCSSSHTRRIRNWFEPLQIYTRLYAMLALRDLHFIFFYIIYLLSNVRKFSIKLTATSLLTMHSRNLMCTLSNFARHSPGKVESSLESRNACY
jgi:hypothetical protein